MEVDVTVRMIDGDVDGVGLEAVENVGVCPPLLLSRGDVGALFLPQLE